MSYNQCAPPYSGYAGPQYQRPAPPYTERTYCGPAQLPPIQYVQSTTNYVPSSPSVTEIVVMDRHHHHHDSGLGTALAGMAFGMALEDALYW